MYLHTYIYIQYIHIDTYIRTNILAIHPDTHHAHEYTHTHTNTHTPIHTHTRAQACDREPNKYAGEREGAGEIESQGDRGRAPKKRDPEREGQGERDKMWRMEAIIWESS